MINYSDLRKKNEIKDIIEFEKNYNVSFPPQYKHHLLSYNGGAPHPDIFSFTEKGTKTNSRINYFYAIGSSGSDNFNEVMETFKVDDKRMPDHILPIAEDPFGNVVCISSGANDFGRIYFWDHEMEVDYSVSDDTDYSNLYFIANSFNEFIKMLKAELDE